MESTSSCRRSDSLNTHPPHTHPIIHLLVINTHIQLWQKFVSHQCWWKLQPFTFWPYAPSIFFHAPWPSTLVVTVKHYANKGQGTSGNVNTSINNRLWLSSCQKRAGMFYPSTTMIQTLAHMHTHQCCSFNYKPVIAELIFNLWHPPNWSRKIKTIRCATGSLCGHENGSTSFT